jgi:hypothetical protein
MQTVAQYRQTLNRLARAYPGIVRDARQDPDATARSSDDASQLATGDGSGAAS